MTSQWFYKFVDEQIGPLSSAELRNLVQRGTVKQDTLVRQTPDGVWVPAERVRGLLTVSNPTPPPIPARATVETKTADSSTAPKRIVARRLLLFIGLTCVLLLGVAIALAGAAIFLHGRDSARSLQEARDAFRAVKKLQARTEIGLTYSEYVDAVGTAWGEVKGFVESPERKTGSFSGLSADIEMAMEMYRDAIEPFGEKARLMDPNSEYGEEVSALCDKRVQESWKQAKRYVDAAEWCLNKECAQ
jgi:hypothetical protein